MSSESTLYCNNNPSLKMEIEKLFNILISFKTIVFNNIKSILCFCLFDNKNYKVNHYFTQ